MAGGITFFGWRRSGIYGAISGPLLRRGPPERVGHPDDPEHGAAQRVRVPARDLDVMGPAASRRSSPARWSTSSRRLALPTPSEKCVTPTSPRPTFVAPAARRRGNAAAGSRSSSDGDEVQLSPAAVT
jgi:hypothetical protein